MAGIVLNRSDRGRMEVVREVLVQVQGSVVAERRDVFRVLGRVEAVVASLLEIVARVAVSDRGRAALAAARMVAADAQAAVLDDVTAAYMLGRMQATAESLLAVVDEGGDV